MSSRFLHQSHWSLSVCVHRMAQAAKLMLALAIYITHGLACYVAFDITWTQNLKGKLVKNSLMWEYVTRTTLVLITCEFNCSRNTSRLS